MHKPWQTCLYTVAIEANNVMHRLWNPCDRWYHGCEVRYNVLYILNCPYIAGIILGMGSANERRHYIVTWPYTWRYTKENRKYFVKYSRLRTSLNIYHTKMVTAIVRYSMLYGPRAGDTANTNWSWIFTLTSQWRQNRRLKSPASRVFTQLFIQAQLKENVKGPRYWPLYGEFTGDWWIPRTNGQ